MFRLHIVGLDAEPKPQADAQIVLGVEVTLSRRTLKQVHRTHFVRVARIHAAALRRQERHRRHMSLQRRGVQPPQCLLGQKAIGRLQAPRMCCCSYAACRAP